VATFYDYIRKEKNLSEKRRREKGKENSKEAKERELLKLGGGKGKRDVHQCLFDPAGGEREKGRRRPPKGEIKKKKEKKTGGWGLAHFLAVSKGERPFGRRGKEEGGGRAGGKGGGRGSYLSSRD